MTPSAGVAAVRVCVLVEGNAPMARYWGDFLHSYILPLLKSLQAQRPGNIEYSLVVYYTRSSYSLCHLERSDWSSNLEGFNSLLGSVHISGGGNSDSCLPEALSEALYLFQCRSSLPQAGNTVNHCLIFSLTEAHNMAIDWPYPLVPASSDQGCQTASFSVGMAEAFRQQGISLSILSTYPPGQSNPVWPSLLYKLFEHAEQGEVQKAKTQDEQQKQQQQRLKLRDQCSVGLQSGHFALLSRQWGEAVQSFQGQRSKRKAAQAFEDAPVNGYHKQTKAEPQGSDGQSFPFQSAVPSKVPIVPVPKAGSTLPDWQTSPFSVAALPRPSAGPPNPAPALSQGSNQASASHDSSPAVDLTSPNMKPRVAEPGVLDLTEEKDSPQDSQGHSVSQSPSLARPQMQPHQPQLQPGPAIARHPHQTTPPHQHPQLQPAFTRDAKQPSQHQQQQPQLQQRQQSSSSPTSANKQTDTIQQQQQQLRQLQLQQHLRQQQQQQQRRPLSAPVVNSSNTAVDQHQQPGPESLTLQQQQQRLRVLQAQRQAAQRQASLAQQQQQQQQQLPVSVPQSSRPVSAPSQQGIQPIVQVQQQLQLQAPHQQQHQQQKAVSAQVMSARRMQPVQNHTLQQIQEMQTELKHRQEQAQRLNQGHPGARQVVDAGPGPSQPGSQQDQGKLGTALGQRQQGHAQRALPQSMPGQAPAALGQVIAGQPPVPLLQSQHNAVVSPATSSTASARPSASQQGMPTVMWQGKVFAAAAVVKRPQDVLMLECRLGVQRATWPPGLEQGWGQHLVVNKLVPLADITKLVGQEVLSQAPRVGLALGPITEWGMSFLKDMAAKKVMAIVQLPHRGKFLGLITAPSSSSPAQVPQKLIGLVLTLHINQQPKQQ
ncbi:TPA: hypothetical protein ACH3X2_011649 [Trebouxia sp. C0005]